MDIVIIGTGNLATNLAFALKKSGNKVKQIIGRSLINTKNLAKEIDCDFSVNINDIADADIYFICVNDDKIEEIANSQNLKNKFLVHCSGTKNISILSSNTKKYGVVYPVQTLKKENISDFKTIPLCIEASDDENLNILCEVFDEISDLIYKTSSFERLKIHISAVFVNNFVNHLLFLAEDFLNKNNIEKEILKLLIKKTLLNTENTNQFNSQTGPAKRNDLKTIQKHKEILSMYDENYFNVYDALTNSILNTYKKQS